MDIIKIIELSNKSSSLKEERIKKNFPKVKKIAKALLEELPVVILRGNKELLVSNILEAELILLDLFQLYEEEGIVLYKIKK